MSWQTGVVDGVNIQRRVAAGGSSYQAAYEAMLSALAAQLAGDFGYTDSGWLCRVWGCADSANLALANAVIESGGARNTVTAATPGANIIPAMTSLTTPSGLAFASSVYDGNYAAWFAFNGSDAVFWPSVQNWTAPQYLGYVSAVATNTVAAYTMTRYENNRTQAPGTWEFQVSSDTTTGFDGTWTTVDTQAGITWGPTAAKTFALATPQTGVKGIRLRITGTQYGTGGTISVAEMTVLAIGTPGSVNACTITGTSYPLSVAPAAGRLYLRAYNADASGLIDIGNSGSNKVEIYRSINGNSTWSAALAIEGSKLIGDNVYDLWTPEFDMTGASGLGFKLQSFARSVAPNLRLLQVLALGRMAS